VASKLGDMVGIAGNLIYEAILVVDPTPNLIFGFSPKEIIVPGMIGEN
jgi:hypothetical protein